MLTQQEKLRYSRHLLHHEIGEQGQLKLRQASVLVIGLGGLGCPAATYLAGAGIGRLILADGDTLDITNLQRQVLFQEVQIGENKASAAEQQLTKLNSDIEIEVIDEMLDEELLAYWLEEADIVLDCTDHLAIRYTINRLCVKAEVPLIMASAIGFDGQLMVYLPEDNAACYECLFPNMTQSINQNCNNSGVAGPVLGILGSKQALIAMNWIMGKPVSSNVFYVFDGLTHSGAALVLRAVKSAKIIVRQIIL